MPVRPFSPEEVQAGRPRLDRSILLTAFASAGLFALAEDNLFFLAASGIAAGVQVCTVMRGREVYAPRLLLNAAVVGVGALLLWRFFTAHEDPLITLGHYVILIQACKFFERKGNRDYVQVLVMSMLLVLAAAMMCQELWFALLTGVYLALLCHTAMVLTLKRNADLGAGAARRGDLEAAWPRMALAWRLGVVLAAIAATGVVVFLIAPRMGGPVYPALRHIRTPAVTGFSDTVRLGERREIYLSDRVVMHVGMSDANGVALAPSTTPYLRGRVFDQYAQSRWSRAARHPRRWPEPPAELLQQAVRQEVSMSPSLLPVAFASHPAVRIVSADAEVRPYNEFEFDLRPISPTDRPIRYTAVVLPQPLSEAHRRWLEAMEGPDLLVRWRRRLEAPNVPRAAALARQWCQDLLADRPGLLDGIARDRHDLAVARRLAERLRREYEYSLDLRAADPDRDGVEDFLFHLKRGHCEYFASALTVMCQSLGLRARLATGFCPGEYDAEAGRYVVRQRDAHAWTEVYTPQSEWVIFDATPDERLEPVRRGGWAGMWARVTEAWRRWEFAWYDKVIGYDDEARQRLTGRGRAWLLGILHEAGRACRDLGRAAVDLLTRGRLDPGLLRSLAAVAAGAVILTGAAVAGRRLRRKARRAATVKAPGPPLFMKRLMALLARHGVRPAPCQTPQELAATAAERLRLGGDVLADLVALYYRIRWARRPAGPAELHAAEQGVRRLADLLSTRRRKAGIL